MGGEKKGWVVGWSGPKVRQLSSVEDALDRVTLAWISYYGCRIDRAWSSVGEVTGPRLVMGTALSALPASFTSFTWDGLWVV